MDNLKLLNGYLVPKTIANNADPTTVAQSAVPGVTYATLKVTVQPATDVALPATQKSAEPSSGSLPSSPTAKATAKKKPA
jgi:hypothetical protein